MPTTHLANGDRHDVTVLAEDGDVVFYASTELLGVSVQLDPEEAGDLIDDLAAAIVAAGDWRARQVGADRAEGVAEERRLERTDPDATTGEQP